MKHFMKAGASKRMEALTDGIFAIVATLLVLEIRVPNLPKQYSRDEMYHAFREIIPSFIAFVFSFLNILVFWFNHDSIGKTLTYFDKKVTFLNFFFLLFISLIPFTTAFISDYPYSLEAISVYGVVLFMASFFAVLMYHHIAFKSDMMHPSVSMQSRKKVWKRLLFGPIAFVIAIFMGLLHVAIPIVIYILMPLFFMFIPGMDIQEENRNQYS